MRLGCAPPPFPPALNGGPRTTSPGMQMTYSEIQKISLAESSSPLVDSISCAIQPDACHRPFHALQLIGAYLLRVGVKGVARLVKLRMMQRLAVRSMQGGGDQVPMNEPARYGS